MNELFPGERILTESADKKVTLTTRRIGYSHRSWGRAYHQHIMLEHVSGCEYRYGSHVWLLTLAGIIFIMGIIAGYSGSTVALLGCITLALLLILLYMLTRHGQMIISSSGTKMRIKTTGLGEEPTLHFLYQLEKAQHEHTRGLYDSDVATL